MPLPCRQNTSPSLIRRFSAVRRTPAGCGFRLWFVSLSVDPLVTVGPRQPEELYSAAEIALLLAFSSAIGLDYGELDVLRETASGRLFVLDANPTPVRPHFMAADDERAAMDLMAAAFADVFADVLSA